MTYTNSYAFQEQDDFFRDEFADDAFSDFSDTNWRKNHDDDFYAYVGEAPPPTLLPLQGRYVIGYLVSSLGLLLGASGGIGGGGIAVPVYLLVMGLGPRAAMGVGAVTILGGSLSSTILNVSRRHPLADRPLIGELLENAQNNDDDTRLLFLSIQFKDWDLILVMQPVVLVGVFLGTFIHQILSEQILVVMLVILLSITAHTTLNKAMRMYQAEVRALL